MGYVVSIQQFSINIPGGQLTKTATINSLTTNNAIIIYNGILTTDTAPASGNGYLTLTNSTTVTATRNTSSNACTIYGTVVEFSASAINVAVQYGTCVIAGSATSGTATINSVDTTMAGFFFLGYLTPLGSFGTGSWSNIELTNSTTVTASRSFGSASGVTLGFCVVEFTSTVLQSSQQRSVTLTGTATSGTDTISSVTAANTILNYGGVNSSSSSAQQANHTLQLTNSTTVTFTRNGTTSATRIFKYNVLEFKSGVLSTNAVQRGTIALNSATTNTGIITSITAANASVNHLNVLTSDSGSQSAGDLNCDLVLTDGTTVTATKNLSTAATYTISFEVIEFSFASTYNETISIGVVVDNPFSMVTTQSLSLTLSSLLGIGYIPSTAFFYPMALIMTLNQANILTDTITGLNILTSTESTLP